MFRAGLAAVGDELWRVHRSAVLLGTPPSSLTASRVSARGHAHWPESVLSQQRHSFAASSALLPRQQQTGRQVRCVCLCVRERSINGFFASNCFLRVVCMLVSHSLLRQQHSLVVSRFFCNVHLSVFACSMFAELVFSVDCCISHSATLPPPPPRCCSHSSLHLRCPSSPLYVPRRIARYAQHSAAVRPLDHCSTRSTAAPPSSTRQRLLISLSFSHAPC